MIQLAKWFEVQCLICGTKEEGSPEFIKMYWQSSGCKRCKTTIGYRVLDVSFYQRQRVHYRDPITNELQLAPKDDLAYKITKKQREKTGNISFKSDLKNEGLLRRPSKSRTNKIMNMDPMKAIKERKETIRRAKELKENKSRRW